MTADDMTDKERRTMEVVADIVNRYIDAHNAVLQDIVAAHTEPAARSVLTRAVLIALEKLLASVICQAYGGAGTPEAFETAKTCAAHLVRRVGEGSGLLESSETRPDRETMPKIKPPINRKVN